VSQKLARASEIRELFDLRSNARVYELARNGMLPGVVRVGRQLRFDMTKIRSFIEAGGERPPRGREKGPQVNHPGESKSEGVSRQ
jgi:hypothetical protein